MTALPTPPEWAWESNDWAAALTLLRSDMLRDKLQPGDVDFTRNTWGIPGIDFEGIRARSGPWSDGEKLFLDLANELFNRGAQVRLADLIATLDATNWAIAMRAVRIKRFGVAWLRLHA